MSEKRAVSVRGLVVVLVSVAAIAGSASAKTATCKVDNAQICREACDKLKGTLTTSGSGHTHTCTYPIAAPPARDWYFSLDYRRDYEALAENTFTTFRGAQDFRFGEARSESKPSAGIGAVFDLNSWLALDVNLSTGEGTSTSRSLQTESTSITSDYRLYMADAGVRLYVYQRPRFRHWIYIGALSALARPSNGNLSVGASDIEISSREFRSTTTLEPVAGVGLAVPISQRVVPSVVIRHSPRRGFSAALLLSLPLPNPGQVIPPELDPQN